MLGSLPYRLKTLYAGTAKTVGKGLTKVGLMSKDVPDRQHRVRHWAHSLTVVHDSAAIAGLDVPWWTYDAIDTVETWLSGHARPIRVFEWGSGASTLWLAGRVDEIHSVEHHKGFADSMAPLFAKHPNITFHVVEPTTSENPAVPSHKPGHTGMDFADYVGTIDEVGGKFDLIVIDGRAREACLTAAVPHLADRGLIVFDNTHRKRYQVAVEQSGLKEQVLKGLTPTLPYPDRTSLLRTA
jgi:hypothetical protein